MDNIAAMTSERDISPIDEFAQIYDGRQKLLQQVEENPLLADLLDQAVAAADSRLAELAGNEAVREHYTRLGGEVVRAAQALDEVAPTLEALGMHEELDRKRQEIAAMAGPTALNAAAYFVEVAGGPVVGAEPAVSPAPPSAEASEKGRLQLTMVIDPEHNLAFNSKIIPTGRDLQISNKDWPEAKVRYLRAEAMRFLAERPGQKFRSRAIWEHINPEEPFSGSTWRHYVASFLQAGHKFNHKRLINVDKSHPRRTAYAFGDFDVTVERTEKPLNIKDETVFTLPDGREVAGKTGRVLNMLWRANQDNPVVFEDVEKLYTPEELAAVKTKRNIFSGLVSSARGEIRDTHYTIIKVLTDRVNPDSHRRYPAYFMVNAEVAGVPGSVLAGAEDLTVTEREAVIEELADDGLDAPLSLHEAAVLAGMLHHYNSWLKKNGLVEFPYEIVEAMNRSVVAANTNGKKTESELKVLRVVAFEKARHLLSDSKRLEEAVDGYAEHNDPREVLLMHLMEYNTDEGLAYLKELLDSVTDFAVTFESGKGFVGRGGYNVLGVRTRLVGSKGETL